eukprot:jgi/Botrbrau1/9624/Bobra.0131s0004.1
MIVKHVKVAVVDALVDTDSGNDEDDAEGAVVAAAAAAADDDDDDYGYGDTGWMMMGDKHEGDDGEDDGEGGGDHDCDGDGGDDDDDDDDDDAAGHSNDVTSRLQTIFSHVRPLGDSCSSQPWHVWGRSDLFSLTQNEEGLCSLTGKGHTIVFLC